MSPTSTDRTREDLRDGMDTRPDEREVTLPKLGPVGMLRWAWRQLTSMRTALFLLLLLAIGAVPGSIWPQRDINAARVTSYLDQHQTIGPWLDRLGFFNVFASPWFAAIYLLLLISLVGCIVPRSRLHLRAMRAQPPRAPRHLERLPAHGQVTVDGSPEEVAAAARAVLKGKRFRLRRQEDPEPTPRRGGGGLTVSAESGFLRETGNLVFHIALVVVIVAVAFGHLLGWRGDVIVPEGQTFSNTASSYDTLAPGPWVNTSDLIPFSVRIDKLDVSFEDQAGGAQFGEPRNFTAYTQTSEHPGAPVRRQVLDVNGPLRLGDASVFLLGNGYAPVITVKDQHGTVLYSQATPFLPEDNNYKSVGAVKVPAARPQQLGLFGFFLPTGRIDKQLGPTSDFPGLEQPRLALGAYKGTLFPGGQPQSVYTLDTRKMTQIKGAKGDPLRLWLAPGQSTKLPNGLTVTFDGVKRWAGLSIRHQPGKQLALVGALAALAGLIASLLIRRRRLFVRVSEVEEDAGGGTGGESRRRTLVTVGGLAKGDDPRLEGAVQDVLTAIERRTDMSGKTEPTA
ncbi:MAG TPA: cytochrome c biogenesis protein ResB [Segeticoccus sp.]|uniref:cytochrome c biogenesis protein ResB n=1 Tax=Segeticoccus sp. TaxID=2706531 RepID=UPI002D7F0A55|nr:cytochrome c biogenesis protein ResB [Segeticoccus sp.]HET8601072.1 cytochrome c biogenesis protein ResB [Segeticoccus sp.]